MSVFQRRRNFPGGRPIPYLQAMEDEQNQDAGGPADTGSSASADAAPANGNGATSTSGTATTALPPPVILARRNTNDNMFPPGGVRNVNAAPNTNGTGGGTPQHDSLTLGQLKAAAAAAQPKEKVSPLERNLL